MFLFFVFLGAHLANTGSESHPKILLNQWQSTQSSEVVNLIPGSVFLAWSLICSVLPVVVSACAPTFRKHDKLF